MFDGTVEHEGRKTRVADFFFFFFFFYETAYFSTVSFFNLFLFNDLINNC